MNANFAGTEFKAIFAGKIVNCAYKNGRYYRRSQMRYIRVSQHDIKIIHTQGLKNEH